MLSCCFSSWQDLYEEVTQRLTLFLQCSNLVLFIEKQTVGSIYSQLKQQMFCFYRGFVVINLNKTLSEDNSEIKQKDSLHVILYLSAGIAPLSLLQYLQTWHFWINIWGKSDVGKLQQRLVSHFGS